MHINLAATSWRLQNVLVGLRIFTYIYIMNYNRGTTNRSHNCKGCMSQRVQKLIFKTFEDIDILNRTL